MEISNNFLLSAIAQAAQAKLNAAQTILNNYTPRQKEVIPSATNDLKNRLSSLKNLFLKEKLNVSEIKEARKIIRHDIPLENQAKYWEDLQKKVIYVNQRDNQVTDTNGELIENPISGGTCNVSSMAMAMKYLGVTTTQLDEKLIALGYTEKELATMQYEDKLDYLGQKGLKNYNRYGGSVTDTASLFNLKVTTLKGGYHDQKWYEKEVLTQLQSGNAVIMSINGHIVRIQGMNENGLIVDDPFGKIILREGMSEAYNYKSETFNNDGNGQNNSYNDNRFKEKHKSKENDDSNVGEDNIWIWKDLEAHGTHWVRVIGH